MKLVIPHLPERLHALGPTIERICKISGTPGASIGVTQGGETIYKANFGYRDIEAQEVPDEQTIFHIASLTKNFAAWAVASLVDEGKLKWDTPIVDILPTFRLNDETLTAKVNIVDCLAHRLGIANGISFCAQGGNRDHIPKEENLRLISNLPQLQGFRDSFLYNNMGYGVVAEVIEALSGQTFGEYLSSKVLHPLGMKRTIITVTEPQPDNQARAYAVLDENTFVKIPSPEAQDGTSRAAAGGIRSCVEDLLTFYNALLGSRQVDLAKSSDTASLVLKEAAVVTGGHNLMEKSSRLEKTYGLGILRAQLPSTLGGVGPNIWLTKAMPIIGNNSASQLLIYGQGCCPGFLSSVFMLEESDTVIVVLTNSLALNDPADWLGQMLLEEVLGVGDKTDFVQLAEETKKTYLESFREAEKQLKKGQETHEMTRSIDEYIGDYYNSIHNFFLRVFETHNGLAMNFQGEDWDVYKLEAYAVDTFSWWISREEQAKRGRWPSADENYFKLKFVASKGGAIDSLIWVHDSTVPSGEKFYRRQPEFVKWLEEFVGVPVKYIGTGTRREDIIVR